MTGRCTVQGMATHIVLTRGAILDLSHDLLSPRLRRMKNGMANFAARWWNTCASTEPSWSLSWVRLSVRACTYRSLSSWCGGGEGEGGRERGARVGRVG